MITNIDATKACAMPGVVEFLCHKDIPGANVWGPIRHDEELFASAKVVKILSMAIYEHAITFVLLKYKTNFTDYYVFLNDFENVTQKRLEIHVHVLKIRSMGCMYIYKNNIFQVSEKKIFEIDKTFVKRPVSLKSV